MNQTIQTRVVHLKLCKEDSCPLAEPHLLVEERIVDLKEGNAVAISYTWGRSDRLPRVIGHRPDQSIVSMVLGQEWHVRDVVVTLDDICSPQEYCWIDQLCIRQNETAEVRQTLAKIPLIYRTLEVIVLFPGSRCQCVENARRAYYLFSPTTLRNEVISPLGNLITVHDKVSIELMPRLAACANSLVWLTWFKRLWTRQELFYAKSIKTRWMSHTLLTCRLWDLGDLPATISSSLAEGDYDFDFDFESIVARESCEQARAELRNRLDAESMEWVVKVHEAYESMKLWIGQSSTSDFYESFIYATGKFLDWLSGVPLIRHSVNVSYTEPGYRLALTLHSVQTERRITTDVRDYVLAVWAEWDHYVVPDRHRNMSLCELLVDAHAQLEQRFFSDTRSAERLLTTLPRGLFGATSSTALWEPTHYLIEECVKDTSDVYKGVYIWPLPDQFPSRSYWFCYRIHPLDTFESHRISPPAEAILSGLTYFRLLYFAILVFSSTTSDLRHRHTLKMRDMHSCSNDYNYAMHEFIYAMDRDKIDNDVVKKVVLAFRKANIDRDAVFKKIHQMTCGALGIRFETAQQLGLQLVAEAGIPGKFPPRLGLMQRDINLTDSKYTTFTRSPASNKILPFEALKLPGKHNEFDTFSVVGVWVPWKPLPGYEVEEAPSGLFV